MVQAWRTAVAIVVLAWLSSSHARAAGPQFRIDNAVFAGASAQPLAESTTLFLDGRIYDFLTDPLETTIVDPAADRITLIDVRLRLTTRLAMSVLDSYAEQLRERTIKLAAQSASDAQRRQYLTFLAQPTFSDTLHEGERLRLASSWLTYEVTTVPLDDSEQLAAYVTFSDTYARLNALLSPRRMPPFPRLALNEVLRREHSFASRVELTVQPPASDPSQRVHLRSEHRLVSELRAVDRRRIEAVLAGAVSFDEVDFATYRTRTVRPAAR